MKKILFTAFFALLSFFASAEEKDSLQIMGWPRDAFTMEPVIDSTLAELMTPDSTIIATAAPSWNTRYRLNSYFIMNVGIRSGEYLIRLTNPRYQTTIKRINIKVRKHEEICSIGEIKMRRLPMTRQLGEAVVTATKIKFYTKGDTLVYNADAFNLAEGSMLDALVEQFPGAELKRDGRIIMNGKMVESVLLNGKDFFKGDNTILLDNLPAYTVKYVKFYDKKSERSEAMKMDMNDARFVMDVDLKREYQIGWLANAEAGGGTHNRWLARLFALRFTPQSRLTLYANANNVHENRKPGRNGDWSPASMGNGTNVTKSGGFDYLIHDKHARWELEGNINASHTGSSIETRQSRERFQTQGSVFNRLRQMSKAQSTNISTNHNFRFILGPENDKYRTQLYIKPRFNYNNSRNSSDAISAEFSANPIGEGDWENLFNGPGAKQTLTDILVNKLRNRQRGQSESLDGGMNTQLYFEMPWSGRRMELTAGVQGYRRKAHKSDLYNLNNPGGHTDNRHRYFETPASNFGANVGLSWGHVLFSKDFHSISLHPTVYYNYAHSRQEKSLYRLDLLEEMNEVGVGTLPSTYEALLSTLDRPNSYITASDKHQANITTSFSYDYDVREAVNNDYVRTALWRLTLSTGVTMNIEELDYDGQQNRRLHRTKWLPTMMVRAERNTPGMKHQIWLEGNYTQQLPAMFSIMGMRFNDDPLNISEGNTALRRTEIYSTYLFYTSDRWGQAKQRRLSGKIAVTFYRNAVAMAQIYNTATGVRTFQPQNVNGNYHISATGNFSTPLDRRRHFTLNIGFNNNFYRNVDLLGTNSPMPVRSIVYTNYMNVPLSVEFSYKKLRLGGKSQVAWHKARSQRDNFQNINGYNFDAGIYGNIRLPGSFQLATDFNYYTRRGYDNAVMNTDSFVWNAQLSKSILHGNLTFALVGYDILGDISNLAYTVNTQGVTETWNNVIPRYGMLRVIYKLSKQPKNKR